MGATAASASPCVDICRMDRASGLCEGCLRTIDEIAAWSRLDEAGRAAVLQQLPARRIAWDRRRAGSADPAPPSATP
jgi:hypothetical protein